jgi:hypothetical protein
VYFDFVRAVPQRCEQNSMGFTVRSQRFITRDPHHMTYVS